MRQDRLTPAERSLRGRMGAYAVHARYDPRVTTAPARAAFLIASSKKSTPTEPCPSPSGCAGQPPPARPTSPA